jgi:hypothetical protein
MTAFGPRARAASIALLAASTMLLAGCQAPAAPAPQGADGESVDQGTSEQTSASKGPSCEENTSDVELFTADGVSNPPENGQVWGDGSELSFDYAGFIEGGTLGYEISYVQDDGAVIPVTGGFFEAPTGSTFSSSDPYFDSTSDGYAGIVSVTMTSNVEFDGDNYTSDSTDVANFCVLLAISE